MSREESPWPNRSSWRAQSMQGDELLRTPGDAMPYRTLVLRDVRVGTDSRANSLSRSVEPSPLCVVSANRVLALNTKSQLAAEAGCHFLLRAAM